MTTKAQAANLNYYARSGEKEGTAPAPPPRVLLVGGGNYLQRDLRARLEALGFKVDSVATAADALHTASRPPAPDSVLLDGDLPDNEALQATTRIRQLMPGGRVLVFSRCESARAAVEAMRCGADDYLVLPFNNGDLELALRRATRHGIDSPQESTHAHIEELGDDLFFLALTPAMRKMSAQIQQLAGVDVPVLILGESGTGKEVAARMLHARSPREHRRFLKVNCAALPDNLLESELFGYEAGAFTGAMQAKPGKFELCDKGTILLDEFGELHPSLQAKLLHVLQDQQFSRLGGRADIKVDVRILAATNVDIEAALAQKKLRADLYYRLNAFTIHMPPLRERREEVPVLLEQFMARLARRFQRPPLPFPKKMLEVCARHSWPGNLRELQNLVKRYLILGDSESLTAELAAAVEANRAKAPAEQGNGKPGDLKALLRDLKGEAEIDAICAALEKSHWSRKEAAKVLNISSRALRNKIRQYGIEPEPAVRKRSA